MILYDLLTSQPIEGNMEIKECFCNESKNWLGNKVFHRINGWKAKKFFIRFYKKRKNFKKDLTLLLIMNTKLLKKNTLSLMGWMTI